jgi:hypothetical protein
VRCVSRVIKAREDTVHPVPSPRRCNLSQWTNYFSAVLLLSAPGVPVMSRSCCNTQRTASRIRFNNEGAAELTHWGASQADDLPDCATCWSTDTFPGILLFNAFSVVHGHQRSSHGSDEPLYVILI